MEAIKQKHEEGGLAKLDPVRANTPQCDAQALDQGMANRLRTDIRERVTQDLCKITRTDCSKPANAKLFGTIGEYLANYILPPIEEIREIPLELHEFREIPRKK